VKYTSTSVSRIVKLCKLSVTKDCEMTSVKKKQKKKRKRREKKRLKKKKMSVPVDRKPERAIQAKIRGIQKKIYIPGGLKTRKGGPGKS
jgi:hypothetical protein